MNDNYFECFFDNTIEGILIIENGFIININKAMLDILKYNNKDEIIGNLATGILIPTINHKYLEYNNATFEEISLITKEGEITPAIIRIKDIKDNNKKYKMVFIQDLTDLKEKESLLIEQSRMAAMGEMISMIAHQWRQPLSSIGTAVSNLKLRINMKSYDENIFNKKLDDVENYLNYMSTTIDDFRNFFKKDREKELTSITYITEIAIDMLYEAFEKNSIKIENKNHIKLENIFLYKNELLQVIINILTNAKDAFYDKKEKDDNKITIEYKELKKVQKIIISDNAGGIAENIIDKVFDPYFSTKDNKNGTGIGLYMCKTIIEKHFEGRITVSNKKDGASFEITILK
ncbi:MAG: PAS domain-containing sensor histidine kinase [Campylobacteraceae bacterium]|nr:PAS domain-containing sensor histidine kinase [Campylobacteraceae bacterium]